MKIYEKVLITKARTFRGFKLPYILTYCYKSTFQSQVWMKEMSQGLPGCEEEDDEDIEEDNGEEEQEEISKSSSKPKTSQQKRKAKLLKLLVNVMTGHICPISCNLLKSN